MPDAYTARELRRVLDTGPPRGEDFYRLKVTGDSSTRWLNITPAQLATIASVLETPPETEDAAEHRRRGETWNGYAWIPANQIR